MKYKKVLLVDGHQVLLGGVKSPLDTVFNMVFMVANEISHLEAAEKNKS